MIVQYNTPEFDHNYGPFPYVMGAEPEEVTDERSKVNILEPFESDFQLAEQDFRARLRRLGGGARFEVDAVVGSAIQRTAGDP